MPRRGFYKRACEAKAIREDSRSPSDFSYQYAYLGQGYAWASPDYIKHRMTEAQVYGYRQQIRPLYLLKVKNAIATFINDYLESVANHLRYFIFR